MLATAMTLKEAIVHEMVDSILPDLGSDLLFFEKYLGADIREIEDALDELVAEGAVAEEVCDTPDDESDWEPSRDGSYKCWTPIMTAEQQAHADRVMAKFRAGVQDCIDRGLIQPVVV